jgi:hypothetical protein
VEPWFLEWWRQQGGLVHQRRLGFYDQLQALVDAGLKHVSWLASYGAFLRLEIPFILQVRLHAELRRRPHLAAGARRDGLSRGALAGSWRRQQC